MKYVIILFLGISLFQNAESRPFRIEQIPNGTKKQCLNCHVSELGGYLNVFGQEVYSNHLSVQNALGNVIWSEELAALDSDGDGFTNGEELLDPNGTWRIGQPDPGDPANLGNPGDPSVVPVSVKDLFNRSSAGFVEINNVLPNPVKDVINMIIEVKQESNLIIQLFDLNGRIIATLDNRYFAIGHYSISYPVKLFAANSLNSGSYILSVNSDDSFDFHIVKVVN
jgi:hypothetical protein